MHEEMLDVLFLRV